MYSPDYHDGKARRASDLLRFIYKCTKIEAVDHTMYEWVFKISRIRQ